MTYYHDWSDSQLDGLISDFRLDKDTLKDCSIILASYTNEDYSGNAYVLFKENDKFYEVNGSHCSCHGLEDQWIPSEVTYEELKYRFEKGTVFNEFEEGMKRVLNDFEFTKDFIKHLKD